MKFKFKQDLVGSILFLIVSSVIWLLIPSQIQANEGYLISSQTFPRVIIGLMWLCSLYLLVVEVIKLIRKEPVKEVEVALTEEFKSILVIGMLVGYWVMLHWLTFMASSIIFATIMLVFFKNKNWKHYGVIISTIVVITVVFQKFLNVKLP